MNIPLNRVTLGWTLVVVSGLWINGGLQGSVTTDAWRLLEAGTLFALLLGLAACGPFRAAFRGLGTVRGGALLCVLCLIGVGQIAVRPRATYPFVSWSMYSHAEVIPHYIEYAAILESGEEIDFPFHRVIPTHEPRSVSYNFSGRLRRTTGPGEDLGAQQEMSRIIRSLAMIYNDRYPIDRIRSVEIRRRSIPLHDVDGPRPVVSQYLDRFSVPE